MIIICFYKEWSSLCLLKMMLFGMKGLLNGSKSFLTLSYLLRNTCDMGFHPILKVTIGKSKIFLCLKSMQHYARVACWWKLGMQQCSHSNRVLCTPTHPNLAPTINKIKYYCQPTFLKLTHWPPVKNLVIFETKQWIVKLKSYFACRCWISVLGECFLLWPFPFFLGVLAFWSLQSEILLGKGNCLSNYYVLDLLC